MTDQEDNLEIPAALTERLKSGDQPQALITARVDRALRQQAESQFATRPPIWRRRPAWAAVAATVLISVLVVQLRQPAIVEDAAIYADVDGSGRIDIADVLAAARNREQSGRSQAELDAFAMRIVSLSNAEDAS